MSITHMCLSIEGYLNNSKEKGNHTASIFTDESGRSIRMDEARIELALSALQQPETSEEILDEIHDTFFDKRFFPKSSWKKVWRDKYIILKRQQE